MRRLEKEKMTKMEEILSHGIKEPDLLVNLFPSCVQEEMAVYGKSWNHKTELQSDTASIRFYVYRWIRCKKTWLYN